MGFQFIKAAFSVAGVAARVWPYILDARRNQFVPDGERYKGQVGRSYFEIDTLAPIPIIN